MALKAVLSTSNNPWFNLALEHYLGQTMAADDHIFYWWQNRPAVIVGCFQDAWAECQVENLMAAAVDLVRRPTGGGAVYHDLGNSNFSFWDSCRRFYANPLSDPFVKEHFAIIIDALNTFGLTAFTYGRNDLGIMKQGEQYKVSGNAFAYHHGKALHHGTLLREVDFKKMQEFLRPHRLKRRGVASHPQQVANLVDFNSRITHQNLGQKIKEIWVNQLGRLMTDNSSLAWITYGENDLPTLLAAGEEVFPYAKWTSRAWNWGERHHFAQSLDFKFSFGLFTVMAAIDDQHKIQQAVIYSDTLQLDLVQKWQQGLLGRNWQVLELLECLPQDLLTSIQQAEVAQKLKEWPERP